MLINANGTGQYLQSETLRVDARELYGRVLYFSNSNTGTLIATSLNKLLEVGDVVIGDTSNASFTISTIETNPLKQTAIVTTPDPSNALPDDDYGFSDTITHWPNT